jgi:hypothetical protein
MTVTVRRETIQELHRRLSTGGYASVRDECGIIHLEKGPYGELWWRCWSSHFQNAAQSYSGVGMCRFTTPAEAVVHLLRASALVERDCGKECLAARDELVAAALEASA